MFWGKRYYGYVRIYEIGLKVKLKFLIIFWPRNAGENNPKNWLTLDLVGAWQLVNDILFLLLLIGISIMYIGTLKEPHGILKKLEELWGTLKSPKEP